MNRSWARKPMRARSAAPPVLAVRSPYRTVPDDGLRSVAAIESSVDLPAPFGPSRATISPARQLSETRLSARRRPKLRVTSWNVRLSKSTLRGANDRDLVVERGVDAFEGGHELVAACRVVLRIDGAIAVARLQRSQFVEQPIAPILQLAPMNLTRRPDGAGADRRPGAAGQDEQRESESGIARPGRGVRHPREREAHHGPSRDGTAAAGDIEVAVRGHRLLLGHLRGAELHVPDLLGDYRNMLQRNRHGLLDHEVRRTE